MFDCNLLVDKVFFLKCVDLYIMFVCIDWGEVIVGVIYFFVIYGMSMMNCNYFIFGDNKGFVVYYWECIVGGVDYFVG